MSRRRAAGRYAVTGPGVEVSYPEVGPAISRTVTAACAAKEEGTWYVRDVDGTPLAYSERDKDGLVITVSRA